MLKNIQDQWGAYLFTDVSHNVVQSDMRISQSFSSTVRIDVRILLYSMTIETAGLYVYNDSPPHPAHERSKGKYVLFGSSVSRAAYS